MLLSLLASTALAAPEPYDHRASITFSPVHLLVPMLEVQGEFRVHDRVGVAAIGGFGRTSGLSLFEGGLSARAYPLGDFDHGLQLGAEATYLGAMGTVGGVQAAGTGLTAGPFAGYKIAARFGLTFELQLGYQWMAVGARAQSGGVTATEEQVDSGVLLNLNLGWSF